MPATTPYKKKSYHSMVAPTMAEVTTLIAEGNSWLKSTYYSIKNMI